MITIIRPFDKVYNNIIKIQNEAFFMFFSVYMIFFSKKERWEYSLGFIQASTSKLSSLNPPEALFILLMTLNCLMTFLIIISNFLIQSIKVIITSKQKPVVPKQPTVLPHLNTLSKSISGMEELKQEHEISPNWNPSHIQMFKTKRTLKF